MLITGRDYLYAGLIEPHLLCTGVACRETPFAALYITEMIAKDSDICGFSWMRGHMRSEGKCKQVTKPVGSVGNIVDGSSA
jgi:hypothetical protein